VLTLVDNLVAKRTHSLPGYLSYNQTKFTKKYCSAFHSPLWERFSCLWTGQKSLGIVVVMEDASLKAASAKTNDIIRMAGSMAKEVRIRCTCC
jgi:hypothetical protein